MSRCCTGLAVVTVAFAAAIPLAVHAQEKPKKFALLVGVNHYQHGQLDKLEFAEADAKDMAKLLKEKGEYEVITIVGADATKARITKELEKLAGQGNRGGIVLVGFAGHGMQPEGSDEAYFVPYDARQKVVTVNGKDVNDWDYNSMVSLSKVLAHLKASPAGAKALLVDACRNDPKAGRGRGFGSNLKLADLPRNLAVLLSCSEGERSFEHADWGHGAFFYHVMKGMEEQAAKKKRVTALTLAAYVKEQVSEEVPEKLKGGARQNPHPLINNDVDFGIHAVATAKIGPAKDPKQFENQLASMPEKWAKLAEVAFGGAGARVSYFIKDGERRCWAAGIDARGRTRVIVLDDTDGDGSADKSTVFASDPDVGVAERIEVTEKGVIVHEREQSLKFTDSDGDSKWDKREVLPVKPTTLTPARASAAAAKLAEGLKYLRGRGVQRDPKKAVELIRESANTGHGPAQHWLAELYTHGYDAVMIDKTQQATWVRKSAEARYAPAEIKWGLSLKNGSLGEKDESSSMQWVSRALPALRELAENGDDVAQYWLAMLYFRGNGVQKSEDEARKWFRDSANAGNSAAKWQLGDIPSLKENLTLTEALGLLRNAADHGHAAAQSALAYQYLVGYQVVKQDKGEAARWYRKAAEQGYPYAQAKLGSLYESGDGVPMDRAEAIKWYRLGAKQGSTLAKDALQKLGVEP